MTCLDEKFLLDAVRARISAAQRITLIHHITECGECRDLVYALFRFFGEAPEPRVAVEALVRSPEPDEEDAELLAVRDARRALVRD